MEDAVIAQLVEPTTIADDKLMGIPYTQEWILADRLEIGPAYQRRIDENWVKRLAADFDPFLLDDLLVNRAANGRLTVMDGQHRLLAIREMGWGDQNVPCKVYDNLPEELQAKRFNTTDVRKRLTAADRFRSALIAKDPDALAVTAIVESAGFRINLTNGETDGGRISAVAAIIGIYKKNRAEILPAVLSVFTEAYGTKTGPVNGMLLGLAAFMTRFRDHYERDRLIASLRRLTPATVLAEGNDASRVLGRSSADGVAFAIWKAYNHGRQDAHRLPEFSATDGRKRAAALTR